MLRQGAGLEQERRQEEQWDMPTGEGSVGWEESYPVEYRASSSHGRLTREHSTSFLLVS